MSAPPPPDSRDARPGAGSPPSRGRNVPATPRPRRAGEDAAALARALGLTQRHGEVRSALDSGFGATPAEDRARVLGALADLAVEEFCTWCRVDVVEEASPLVRGSDTAALAARVPEIDGVVADVVRLGQRVRLPVDVTRGLPYLAATALRVHDRVIGSLTFVRRGDEPGFGPMELTAIDEVTWAASTSLERLDLRRQTAQAAAEAARTTEQLRALLEAALALRTSGQRADVAALVAEHAPAILGAPARLLDEDAPSGAPEELRVDLVAPGGTRRGTLALEASAGSRASDAEMLALLAALAAAALEAGDLTAALAAGEARWRALVDSAPIAIVEGDRAGQARWWNRRAATLLAWPEAGPAAWPAALTGPLTTLWRRAASGVEPQSADLVGLPLGGRPRDLRVVAQHVAGVGDEPALLTLIDDLTEWRLVTEELRHAQTMELRGQVAGAIVHDFNNLLTLISGYADLLGGQVDGEARASVEEIARAAERAAALAAQLQTLGRTQSAEPRVLDPAEVLVASRGIVERIVGRDVDVDWSLADSGPVHVDPDRFEQMILNLVLNARDAMPTGGSLAISLHQRRGRDLAPRHHLDPETTYVVVRVIDTGTGMDEETRQHCFEPLFTTKGLKGNGLGLTAARRLMVDSDGSIAVDSALGAGTTFEAALPRWPDAEPARPAAPAAPAREAPAGPAPATVLVVEDDAGQRRLAVGVLERLGHRVLEAGSAEEALALGAGLADVDLLVSDVVLAAIPGDELARRLRDAHRDLAVLLVSGTAGASIAAGIPGAAFLAKPFRPSDLVEQVSDLLARRNQRDAGSKR